MVTKGVLLLNIVIIVCLAFLLLILASHLLEKNEDGVLLSVSNVIIGGISFLWGMLFPIIYIYSLTNQNNEYLVIISNYDAFEMIKYYLCVDIFLIVFVKSFRIASNKQHIHIYSLFTKDDSVKLDYKKSDHLYNASILLFVVGMISDFLYCRAYGGYLGYIEYSAFIRSGVTNLVNNQWSFLIVFRDCVLISSYLFFSQLKKNNHVQIGRIVLFVISFAHSLLILYANRGRLSFLIYVAVFVVAFWIDKNKIRYIKLNSVLSIITAFLIFVVGLSWISGSMGRASDFDAWDTLCNEVSFCFANFKLLLNKMNINDARLFLDIVSYPLFLLPSSLWRNIMPDTASDFMTILVSGNKKGQGGVFGETPIDSISIGYLQFGVIGVSIFAVFFGVLFAKMYNLILKINSGKARAILAIYVIIEIFLRSLYYADSYNIVQRCFSLIVFALLYWFCDKFLTKEA